MHIGSELQILDYVEMASVQFHPLHSVQIEFLIAWLIALLIAKHINGYYYYYYYYYYGSTALCWALAVFSVS
jgi:hypothetical protein